MATEGRRIEEWTGSATTKQGNSMYQMEHRTVSTLFQKLKVVHGMTTEAALQAPRAPSSGIVALAN